MRGSGVGVYTWGIAFLSSLRTASFSVRLLGHDKMLVIFQIVIALQSTLPTAENDCPLRTKNRLRMNEKRRGFSFGLRYRTTAHRPSASITGTSKGCPCQTEIGVLW